MYYIIFPLLFLATQTVRHQAYELKNIEFYFYLVSLNIVSLLSIFVLLYPEKILNHEPVKKIFLFVAGFIMMSYPPNGIIPLIFNAVGVFVLSLLINSLTKIQKI